MNQSPDPYDQLLVARPTDEASVLRVESQTEVASSVAFQAIDDQFHAGKLTSTEVAVYKARYMKVHEALKKTRENEFGLIQLSKRYMAEIEEQEQHLSKADQFPDNTITEPAQMRAQILNYYNSAMETDERVEMLQYEAGLLREERKLLNRDYSRLPMAELEALSDDVDIFTEMERRMKMVQNQCQDLWLEIDMLKMEAKRSREQFRQASDMEHEAQSDLLNLGQRMNEVKAEWVIATDLPGQYSKEAEKARKYKSNAEKELQNLQQEFTELSETLSNLELQLNDLEAEELSNHEELKTLRVANINQKEMLDKTVKLHDSWYEMEMMNRTEKARYLQRLHVAEQDRRDIAEETTKLARERDAYIRHYKKLQTLVEVLRDNVKVVQQLYDKARARYIVTPRYDGEMLQRKRRLNRAIGHLQQELEDEHKRTATEVAHLSRTVGASERRLALMEYLRAENWELIRLTTTLTEGLGKAIFEYTNARNKHERLLEDLEEKNREMQEHQKALDELGSRLADVSAMYTKMKLERNKCVSLLQASVKLALDTRERLRIHMNEAEIIIFRLQRQDQELFRERSLYQSSVVQRDHKRNELCKLLHQHGTIVVPELCCTKRSQTERHAEQNSRREQMRRSICRINAMFNQTEAETLGVKKAKERCAQIRNERALLLIERNQEVYILQERILAQDAAARAGQLTLLSIQEEYEFLKRYRNDLARHVDLVRRMLPTHNKLSAELQGLIHQLVGSRMELNRLVELVEDPDVPRRLRLLGGKDPSQHELWITLGRLERRMAAKEEDMAEKNLTYEAVCRLVDSLQVRVAAG
ncbi:Coiled-coil domain-containing protein 146, partial [Clonorchis sinensis]